MATVRGVGSPRLEREGSARARAVRVIVVCVAAGVALVISASGASAHAQLVTSDPHPGQVVTVAPSQVMLTFSEPVDAEAGAVQVLDDHLRPVATGPVTEVGTAGSQIAVSLPTNLGKGTFTVTWRVSSADTHPVSGTFQFSVGAPSKVSGQPLVSAQNDLAGRLLGVSRWLGYLGLVCGPGLLVAVLALWGAGLAQSRTQRVLWLGFALLVVSTITGMVLERVWASGAPLAAIWSSWRDLDSHSRRFDRLYGFRFYLVVAFGLVLAAVLAFLGEAPSDMSRRGRGGRSAKSARMPERAKAASMPARLRRPALVVTAVTSAALMLTWPLAGHAAADPDPVLAVLVNFVHLAAMTVWLGGLTLLVVCLGRAARAEDLADILPRFSRIAFSCIVAIVATGAVLAVREVGSPAAMVSTEYGRILSIKLLGVIVIVVLGNAARIWVRHHHGASAGVADASGADVIPTDRTREGAPASGRPTDFPRFLRGLVAELTIGATVLALTAALVVVIPARQDYVTPYHHTVTTATMHVDLDVPQPQVGDRILHVTVRTPAGQPLPVTAMSGSVSLPDQGLGPIALEPSTPGGAAPSGEENLRMSVPAEGTWTLRLTVQTSPLDATALSAQIPIS